jgi:bacterioferritin (cytochrome b1)
MTFPKDYKNIHDALVNSLKSETDSYKHFRNYLVSGNKTEDEISTDLLTNALQYEMIYSEFLSKPLPNSSQMNDTVNYISSVPSGLMSYYDRHLR